MQALESKAILPAAVIEELTAIRRELHAHPEVSGQEYETAKRIVRFLQQYQPDEIIEGLGGTGVAAIFNGKKEGPSILFRAELDALSIEEVNTFEHRSQIEGVSHKCGHDGHMTCLLGLAKKLGQERPDKGRAILLFQPAEEVGAGAQAVLDDKKFEAIHPDFVFAFHNLPGYPLNQIVVREGAFTAAVTSIIIRLRGKTAHAAEPEHGHNPALAIAEILTQMDGLSNNEPDRDDFVVITPIHVEMGKIYYGISAGYGEVRLTLRTWTQDELEKLKEKVVQIIQTTAERHHLRPEFEWTHFFHANENGSHSVQLIRQAAAANGLALTERARPFKWGEDFGLFTQKFKGAMFGIGSGEDSPALHNPDYDFPDEMIPVGVAMFFEILLRTEK